HEVDLGRFLGQVGRQGAGDVAAHHAPLEGSFDTGCVGQLRVSGTIHADQRLPSDVAVQFETVILVVVNSVSAGAPTVDEHFAHRSMVSPFSRSTGRNAT